MTSEKTPEKHYKEIVINLLTNNSAAIKKAIVNGAYGYRDVYLTAVNSGLIYRGFRFLLESGEGPSYLVKLNQRLLLLESHKKGLHKILKIVLEEYGALGIKNMVIKGPSLEYYTGERVYFDIDLLIEPSKIRKAIRALENKNFRHPLPGLGDYFFRYCHHYPMRDGRYVFELHWDFDYPTAPFRIDIGDIFARSKKLSYNGLTLNSLSPEDYLIYLSVHLAYHNCFKNSAVYLLDMINIIDNYDIRWNDVVNYCKQYRVCSYAYKIMNILTKHLDIIIPSRILHQIHDNARKKELLVLNRLKIGDILKQKNRNYELHQILYELFLSNSISDTLHHLTRPFYRAYVQLKNE